MLNVLSNQCNRIEEMVIYLYMKLLLRNKKLLIGLLLISSNFWAQNAILKDSCDVIILKDKSRIYVRVIEITSTEIHCHSCDPDSINKSGNWIKKSDLEDVVLSNQALKENNREIHFSVEPAIAEVGLSFNVSPSKWHTYDVAGEIRLRIKESEHLRHFIYPRLSFIHYVASSKPLTTYTNYTFCLGYHAELKKGRSRFRMSYGAAVESYYINKNQSKYTSPYGIVSPAEEHNYYRFGIVARIGVQYYISQYCHVQLNLSGGFGSPYYEGKKVYSSKWVSFASSQFPSIALFGRLPSTN